MAEPAPGARAAQVPRLAPGWVSFLSIVAVFIALRVPSLIEPPTFNDEGTYSYIGWARDQCAVLYRDVWGHYTPGMYWLGAALNLVNTSVLAFHVVLAGAGGGAPPCGWVFFCCVRARTPP